MIKSIRLQNFFGFQDCTINLEKGENVLVGINGSGKSNFFKAFKLLYDGLGARHLNLRINKTWRGLNDVLNKTISSDEAILDFIVYPTILKGTKSDEFTSLSYTLKLQRYQKNDYLVSEEAYLNKGDNEPELIFSYSNGEGIIAEYEEGKYVNRKFRTDFGGKELMLSSYFEEKKSPHFAILQNELSQITCYSQFDTLEDSQMRESSPPLADKELDEYGDNLVSVLNYLKLNHKSGYRSIIESLQKVNPNFEDIDYIHASNQLEMHLSEKGLDASISPQHISDGTLRFLCLMAILYNPNRGTVVCIDEPELGLHPDMINTLYRAIEHAAETSQVIISTHSSHLLDYFELENIRVFEKDDKNATVVYQYSAEDFQGWYDSFLPGQMWRAGDIGGKRW